MVEYSERLKTAMAHANMKTRALSDAIGMTYQGVKKVLDGKSNAFSAENNSRAAAVLGVNPDWLATGAGAMAATSNVEPSQDINSFHPPLIDLDNNPDYPAIRRVRFALSAGAHGYAVEYEEEPAAPIVFKRQWYERNGYRPEKLFAVRVMNGSMEPGLYDGDVVVVNTEATTPKDGCVFAVNYEGEMVIKRLVRDAGSWWLSSDNPDQRRYPRKVCDEHCILIGQIVHKQSERI